MLLYHPDKTGATTPEDTSFFKCIQKSYELLSNPEKRRQYDSIDPHYSDDLPEVDGKLSEEEFFKLFEPLFKREARFSKGRAMGLGDMKSSRKHVDTFYHFWLNFDSWRSFEWLDEEDMDAGEK